MHDIWHWGVCRQRDTSLINGIFDLNTNDPRTNKVLQDALEAEHRIQVYIHFAFSENMWKASAHSGNDLEYHGEAHKIGDAIANALDELVADS